MLTIKKYQVTIYNAENKYKPISCIVNFKQSTDADLTIDKQFKQEIQNLGIIKICQKKYWSKYDLKNSGYTRVKCRAVED